MTDRTPPSWHSHIYFDAESHPRAEALVEGMRQAFGETAAIIYGRWHHKPVGPHPDFSIQLEYPHHLFAAVMTHLALRRDGLTIFTHPNTGEDTLRSFATTATMPLDGRGPAAQTVPVWRRGSGVGRLPGPVGDVLRLHVVPQRLAPFSRPYPDLP